jgi:hypothetical protein
MPEAKIAGRNELREERVEGVHFAFDVGEEVEALFDTKVKRWWRGHIHDRDVANNTYHVKFADGDQRTDVLPTQIRKYEQLKVGDAIFGKWTFTMTTGKEGRVVKLRQPREEYVRGKVHSLYDEGEHHMVKVLFDDDDPINPKNLRSFIAIELPRPDL